LPSHFLCGARRARVFFSTAVRRRVRGFFIIKSQIMSESCYSNQKSAQFLCALERHSYTKKCASVALIARQVTLFLVVVLFSYFTTKSLHAIIFMRHVFSSLGSICEVNELYCKLEFMYSLFQCISPHFSPIFHLEVGYSAWTPKIWQKSDQN